MVQSIAEPLQEVGRRRLPAGQGVPAPEHCGLPPDVEDQALRPEHDWRRQPQRREQGQQQRVPPFSPDTTPGMGNFGLE